MRALKLKQNNNIEDALTLFSELLETQVIHDINLTNKDNKLFSVKYNCYRNIGLIYEEKNDQTMALQYLLNVCVEFSVISWKFVIIYFIGI